MNNQSGARMWFAVALSFLGGFDAKGAFTASLKSDVKSPQLLGTVVNWTITATDTNPGQLDFQFSFKPMSGSWQITQDFSTLTVFAWAQSETEGTYQIQVIARNRSTLATTSLLSTFLITSRVTGASAVVSTTANPLVALYSAPSCPAGSSVLVRFLRGGSLNAFVTSSKACNSGFSSNFYVAGMRAATLYNMRHEITTGSSVVQAPYIGFTTGIPTVPFPTRTVLIAANGQSSLAQGILLHTYVPEAPRQDTFPVAIDLLGNVVWYYSRTNLNYVTRPVAGGTILLQGFGPGSVLPSQAYQNLLEIDLAGNTIRATNAGRISEQLVARGQPPIGSLHHEAIRLANRHTLVLASVERIYTDGAQGSSIGHPVDVLGAMLVDLDQNFQVTWNWNAFDHLDVNRAAILGETCTNNTSTSCPPLFLASTASDWLHTNSINYIPSDGNLIISMRHQDWIIKIDYRNGTGGGNVLWHLGNGGDFQITSTDPHPWFSHQHDAEYESGGTQMLSLFDNGNTRQATDPTTHSRGQILVINETQRTVSLNLNVDLGVFCPGWGSAQLLHNGNAHFLAGYAGTNSQSIEVLPSGAFNFEVQSSFGAYRSFRMATLYAP